MEWLGLLAEVDGYLGFTKWRVEDSDSLPEASGVRVESDSLPPEGAKVESEAVVDHSDSTSIFV